MPETIFSNARLVLPDGICPGGVRVRDGAIAEILPGHVTGGVDLEGDLLLPGLIDLHTDNLERQVAPRPNARWPSRSALFAHDSHCVAAGITTVLDALCLGDVGFEKERIRTFHDGIADLDALGGTGLLKAEHFLHLRCELPAPDMLAMFDPVAAHPRLRLVSLMDHCPGFGQYADLDYYRALKRRDGFSDLDIDRLIETARAQRARVRAPNRAALLARLAGRGIALASHDDRTEDEVAENAADAIGISEFPVSMAAARAAQAVGMQVIAGAPNIVRGGSHSGNVAAADLVAAGAVDALASDYVPSSLIEAAFACVRTGLLPLHEAIALVTERPARMAGFTDRGRLAAGLRADLVRVRVHDGLPVVRAVLRAGERVG